MGSHAAQRELNASLRSTSSGSACLVTSTVAQLHGVCVLRREEFHFLSESTLFLLPSLRISIFMQFSNSDVSFLECPLDHETFDLVLEGTNLAHQVRSLVRGDAAADHSSRDSAGTA